MSPDDGYLGGGMSVSGDLNTPDLITVNMYNCLFNENHSRPHPMGTGHASVALSISQFSNCYVINSTFGNQYSDSQLGGNIGVVGSSDLIIYNSILFKNNPCELYMYNTMSGDNNLKIFNSLIQGGKEGIRIYTPGNILVYDSSNINSDPTWDTLCLFPYSLSFNSPCIDAGTLSFPPNIELPGTDLAGNPRIYNGFVDMGAYEYGPWVGIQHNEIKLPLSVSRLLEVWPNPFMFEANISYINPKNGSCTIRIWDMNGRIVKTLLDVNGQSGRGVIKWEGDDQFGNIINYGTYLITITIDGKVMDTLKIIKR